MEPPYNTMCHSAIRLCTNTPGTIPHPVCLYRAFSEKQSCHKEARLYSHYTTYPYRARPWVWSSSIFVTVVLQTTWLWWIVSNWSYLPSPIILGELVKIITPRDDASILSSVFCVACACTYILIYSCSKCILRGKYHGCWWPGDARSQGICSPGFDLVRPEHFGLSTRKD